MTTSKEDEDKARVFGANFIVWQVAQGYPLRIVEMALRRLGYISSEDICNECRDRLTLARKKGEKREP